MKLFSWAQNKLLPYNHGSNKHVQPNAGRLSDIRRHFLASDDQSGHTQAKANNETPVHSEVLTIGTFGMGNLLNFSREKEEEETEDEQDSDDENDDEVAHYISPIVDPLSPTRESMSSNRESLSSNRESVSSNHESVSSIDIQKLQEELQKILYFKIGQATGDQARPSASKGSSTACNGSRVKEARREGNEGYGKESGKKNMRELMPLHNFLEMPMDTILSKSKSKGGAGEQGLYKLLTKRHYWLLMQSLKSRLLHSTHITIAPPLFESLVHKPSSKAFHILQKLKKQVPNGWTNWNGKAEANNERPHVSKYDQNNEEERLNWAISRSYRGSERFINYITSTLAQIDKNGSTVDDNQHQGHQSDHSCQSQEASNMQQLVSTSPFLANESWINTDDDYLVLEL